MRRRAAGAKAGVAAVVDALAVAGAVERVKDLTYVNLRDWGASDILADRCEAMLQGSNRLQRGLNYVSYLRALAPTASPVTASFEGGHNNSAAFFSEAVAHWTFAS